MNNPADGSAAHSSPGRHVIWRRVGIVIAAIVVVVILALTFMDWNLLKHPIERIASAKSGRSVTIAGRLQVHIWSWTPSIDIDGLTVGNPPWEAGPPLLQMKRLEIRLKLLPLLKGEIILPRVTLLEPHVYLHQEKSGRANWTFENKAPSNAKASPPTRLPVVRDFLIESGTLKLIDDIRHLKVDGTVEAHEKGAHDDPKAFRIQGKGSLNEEPFALEVAGGPLINLDPHHPYPFDIHITAGNLEARSSGTIQKPFDLGEMTFEVDASGADLADLYYLTQLALPNTPPFKLHARIQRHEMRVLVSDIAGTVGRSDLRGNLEVDASRKRPDITGQLLSNRLALSDLAASLGGRAQSPASLQKPQQGTGVDHGARSQSADSGKKARQPAHGGRGKKASEPSFANGRLFPDARLQVERVRAMDADVRFNAKDIEAGSFPLKQVDLHVKIDDGVLSIAPFAFEMPQGRLAGQVRIDATKAVPRVRIDARMKDIQLAQLKGKAPNAKPAIEGVMQARVALEGTGDSVHRVMADANGTFTLVLPHGQVNAAFAELTGINVARGIGLLLKGANDRAEIRCGVADFRITAGDMKADKIMFDTQDVLITGRGDIRLGPEQLNLSIKGQPKHLRLARLRSPIEIKGQLLKPSIGIDVGDTVKQGAIAAALGTVITPFAAILAFVDPGLAKDQNCAALLATSAGKATAPAVKPVAPH